MAKTLLLLKHWVSTKVLHSNERPSSCTAPIAVNQLSSSCWPACSMSAKVTASHASCSAATSAGLPEPCAAEVGARRFVHRARPPRPRAVRCRQAERSVRVAHTAACVRLVTPRRWKRLLQ